MSQYPRVLCLFLLTTCFLTISAQPTSAAEVSYLSKKQSGCETKSPAITPELSKFSPVEGLNFVVNGGKAGGEFCFQTLTVPGMEIEEGFIFAVFSLTGKSSVVLDQPKITDEEALEECWPTDIGFYDINGDDIPDFLAVVSCYNGEQDVPQNGNVAYLSVKGKPFSWEQSEKINATIAKLAGVVEIQTALIGKTK